MLDALVLLGCRTGPGPLPGAAERRTQRAAEAYHAGLGRLLLVSGGRRWGGQVEADVLASALRERGVPDHVLHLERASLTTRDNARYSAALLAKLGAKTVGLVSSDWHLPRALACFRRMGVDAEGVPAPSPDLRHLGRAWRRAREYVAWLIDRLVMLTW